MGYQHFVVKNVNHVKRTLLGLLFATISCFLFEGTVLAAGMTPVSQSPNPLVLAPGQTGTVTYQVAQNIPMPIETVTIAGFPGAAVPSLSSCAGATKSCSFTVTYTQPVSGGSYTATVTVISKDRQVAGTSFQTTISPATISAVNIQPLTATVVAGKKTAPFSVTGCAYQNGFQGACPVDAAVLWDVDNTAVATIDSSGVATGIAVGSANIIAKIENATSAKAALTVTAAQVTNVNLLLKSGTASLPLGKTAVLGANCDYTDGSTAECTNNVTWHVSSNAVTVGAEGMVTTNAVGSSTVIATVDGMTSNGLSLTVTPAQLTNIAISPGSASVPTGSTAQLTAYCTYTNGVAACPSLVWASSNESDATVTASGSSAGLAKGVAPGSATITASYAPSNGVKVIGSANLTVSDAVLTGIALNPNSTSVVAGNTQQFTPVCTFTNGTGRCPALTWASSDDSLATVDQTGLAKGLKEGKPVITATYAKDGKVVGSANVSVGSAVIKSVTLALTGSATIPLGRTATLSATCGYTDGTSVSCTGSVAWGYSSGGVVTVGSTGTVTTNQIGSTTVTATVGGVKSNGIALTVDSAALTGVTLSWVKGTTAPLPLGTSSTLLATCAYSDKTVDDCTGQATWGYSQSGIVTVGSSGVVTTTAVGSTSVTATISGVASNPISVTVSDAALSSIALKPNYVGVATGSKHTFTATCTYTNGVGNCPALNWASSNVSYATVDASGVATGMAEGNATITASYTPSGGATVSGSATLSVGQAVLTEIALSPGSATVAAGDTTQFTATCTFTNGSGSCPALSWSSADNSLATVNAGLATGVVDSQGKAVMITASYTPSGSSVPVTAGAELTVGPAVVNSVGLTAGNDAIAFGTTTSLTATCTYSDGTSKNCTSSATFSASPANRVTIGSDGMVTPKALGATTITATAGGKTSLGTTLTVVTGSAATVILNPVTGSTKAGRPALSPFTAVCDDAGGNNVSCSDSGLTWTMTGSATDTTIDSGSGLITPGKIAGTETVTATLGNGKFATAEMTITASSLDKVTITGPSQAQTGTTVSYVATCADQYGNPINPCSSGINWSVSGGNASIGNPNTNPVNVAVGTETATVSVAAAVGGVPSNIIRLTVGAGALARVTVTGSANEVISGSAQPVTYTATCADASGNAITPCTVTSWAISNNGSAATIDSTSGNVIAGNAAGTATITATVSQVPGTANLVVSPVTVSPVLYFQAKSSITNTASQPVVGTIVISNPAAGSGGTSGDAIGNIAVTVPTGFTLTGMTVSGQPPMSIPSSSNNVYSGVCGQQINAGSSCTLQFTAQAPIDFSTPPVITVTANDLNQGVNGVIQPVKVPVSPLGMILMTPKVQVNAQQSGFTTLTDGNVYLVKGCSKPSYVKFENMASQATSGNTIISAVGIDFQDSKGNSFDVHHYAFNPGSCASTTFDGVPNINSATSCLIAITPTSATATQMQLAMSLTSNGTKLAYTIPVILEAGGQPLPAEAAEALPPLRKQMTLLSYDTSCNQMSYGINTSDQFPWWNSSTVDPTTISILQKTHGGGVAMTAAIVNAISGQSGAPAANSFAAGVCDGLLHTDQNNIIQGNWYLPSYTELGELANGPLAPFLSYFFDNQIFWTSTLFSGCTSGDCAFTSAGGVTSFFPVDSTIGVMCSRTVIY